MFSKLFKENKNYPSRSEAEALIEWSNAVSNIYLGGSSKVRRGFEQSEKIRLSLWQDIFGENSPWSVIRDRKGRGKIYWDDDKADKLGL